MDDSMREEYFEEIDYEEERLRRQRRQQRIEEMRRQKKRTVLLHRMIFLGACVAIGVLAGFGIIGIRHLVSGDLQDSQEQVRNQPGENEGGNSYGNALGEAGTGNSGSGQGGNGLDQDGTGLNGSDPDKTGSNGEEDYGGETPLGAYGAGGAGSEGSDGWGDDVMGPLWPEENRPVFAASTTSSTAGFTDTMVSPYGIFIDVSQGTVLAQREGYARMNPASMTKILTVLVAAQELGIRTGEEAVLEDTVEITIEITDYCFVNDCSVVGFEVGEKVTVRDLFYGTILPSGADAALGLANYVAGSQEAFVELMNRKLSDLGMAETTHFTNCVGLYDENHYSTAYDIAMILKTAADNDFCRQALSAHTYNTSLSEQHPEGLLASNWFLRRIEDKDTHGEVLCGKTGYVTQSGSCAASLGVDRDGREYLCVTAGAGSSMLCIADHVELYQRYLPTDGESGE